MARALRLAFVLAMLLADISTAAQIGTPTLVSIQTPRGAAQGFILIKVDNPVASASFRRWLWQCTGLKKCIVDEMGSRRLSGTLSRQIC